MSTLHRPSLPSRLQRCTQAALTALLLSVVATAAAVSAEISTPPEQRHMQVFLDESKVGQHIFRFDETDDILRVRSEAEFEVKLAFITLFDYEHEANERWRGGCLVGLESKTNENGKRIEVASQNKEAGLELTTSGDSHQINAECPWSFAYWTPGLRERELLVNPQDGAALAVNFEDLGPQTLEVGGSRMDVRAWKLRGRDVRPGKEDASEVRITIYYDEDDCWAGLDSEVGNGRTLRYRPAPGDICHPKS